MIGVVKGFGKACLKGRSKKSVGCLAVSLRLHPFPLRLCAVAVDGAQAQAPGGAPRGRLPRAREEVARVGVQRAVHLRQVRHAPRDGQVRDLRGL